MGLCNLQFIVNLSFSQRKFLSVKHRLYAFMQVTSLEFVTPLTPALPPPLSTPLVQARFKVGSTSG